MLGLYTKGEIRLRSMYKINSRQDKSVRQFFYPHIEPDSDLSNIKLPVDVNWTLFFQAPVGELTNIWQCMQQLLEYTSGGQVQGKVTNQNMIIYYNNRDQLARTVLIDATTSNIIRNESDYMNREFLVSLMMMQDYIQYNPRGLSNLQISAVSSYQGFRISIGKVHNPPEIYQALSDQGVDPTLCEYMFNSYIYIFVNIDVSTLMTTPLIQHYVQQQGLQQWTIGCAGMPTAQIHCIDIPSARIRISNLTYGADTLVRIDQNYKVQHPIQAIFMDSYARVRQSRQLLEPRTQLPIVDYMNILLEDRVNVLNSQVQPAKYYQQL